MKNGAHCCRSGCTAVDGTDEQIVGGADVQHEGGASTFISASEILSLAAPMEKEPL